MPLPNNSSLKKKSPQSVAAPISQQPVSSVSISKEKERISEEKILEEVRENLEVEMEKEVKEAGVTEIKETIELPEKLSKETGAMVTGEDVPVSTKPTITLPLDDQKIKQGLKKNIVESILWLAHWCLRQIKIAQVKALKLVGIKT